MPKWNVAYEQPVLTLNDVEGNDGIIFMISNMNTKCVQKKPDRIRYYRWWLSKIILNGYLCHWASFRIGLDSMLFPLIVKKVRSFGKK